MHKKKKKWLKRFSTAFQRNRVVTGARSVHERSSHHLSATFPITPCLAPANTLLALSLLTASKGRNGMNNTWPSFPRLLHRCKASAPAFSWGLWPPHGKILRPEINGQGHREGGMRSCSCGRTHLETALQKHLAIVPLSSPAPHKQQQDPKHCWIS